MDANSTMGESERQLRIFMVSLLNLMVHVIKIVAEDRVTGSWTNSIYNSIVKMYQANKRNNNSLRFKNIEEVLESVNDTYELALDLPSEECFNKQYDGRVEDFSKLVDRDQVINLTIQLTCLIFNKRISSKEEVIETINRFKGFD